MEEELKEIFFNIFDLDDDEILENLDATEYKPWDSITHLMIITEIESIFNIIIPEEKIPELYTYKLIRNELKEKGL